MAVVRVLDAVELHRGGERVPVRPGKTTELFIRLALEAGSMVRTELLLEDLWSDDGSGRRATRSKRPSRGCAGSLGDAALVTGNGAGYTLNVDRGTVDALLEVVRLAEEASLARSARRPVSRARVVFEGTGPLRRRRAAPCRRRRVGHPAPGPARGGPARAPRSPPRGPPRARHTCEVIGDLEALVHAHPEREGFAALLMVALYRDGRQADALATYQRTRSWLLDELGLDPGSDLQQLEQEILAHDPSLGVPQSTIRALAPKRPPGTCPAMSAELIGRDTDLAAIVDLLTDSRLVEVVGPGGVGKTAAAIAAGRSLRGSDLTDGGVWLARLETAVSADDVVDTVVAALNVGGEGALLERLKNDRTVLILDNCEHVLDSATELAARLLDAAPGLRILCTSQAPLGLDGEVVFELAPLAISDAVALFTDRAGAHRANRASVVSGDAVEDLCLSLDGLPLAIELAAARTRTLSVEEITRRLDDRFRVLADPTSRRPERRRALRSTIGWSYELLFPDDQRGLWALATFAGGAPLPAVEAVLEALAVPAPPRSTSSAGSPPVPGHRRRRGRGDRRGSVPAPGQHPGVRARSDGRRRPVRPGERSARGLVRGGRPNVDRRGAQRRAERAPRLRPDRASQHRHRADLDHRSRPSRRPRPGDRLRLGLDRPRRQPRRTADPGRARRRRRRRTGRRPRQRAAARGLDRSLLRAPRPRQRAHHRRHPDRRADR